MRLLLAALIALVMVAPTATRAASAAPPAAVRVIDFAGGRLALYKDFPSRFVDPRPVYVWTPRGYDTSRARDDVLYMQDGQNVFLAAESYGGQTWGAAEHLQALIDARKARPTIIVGVWNNGAKRGQEYAPLGGMTPADRAALSRGWGGPIVSDRYVRFLTEELKPFVDRAYRTRPGRAHTFLMGSSMGGLISLYAALLHPEVFGGAACLSTHWPVVPPGAPVASTAADTPAADFLAYVDQTLPAPRRGPRLYFDHGDATLDAGYAPFQMRMDAILARHGYRQRRQALSLVFPGAAHNEASWRARLDEPLVFLLGTTPAVPASPPGRQ